VTAASHMLGAPDVIVEAFQTVSNNVPSSPSVVPFEVPDVFEDDVLRFVSAEDLENLMEEGSASFVTPAVLRA